MTCNAIKKNGHHPCHLDKGHPGPHANYYGTWVDKPKLRKNAKYTKRKTLDGLASSIKSLREGLDFAVSGSERRIAELKLLESRLDEEFQARRKLTERVAALESALAPAIVSASSTPQPPEPAKPLPCPFCGADVVIEPDLNNNYLLIIRRGCHSGTAARP